MLKWDLEGVSLKKETKFMAAVREGKGQR